MTVKLGLFRHSELWGEADEGCDDEKAERTPFHHTVPFPSLFHVCHVCVSKDRVAPPLCDETTCFLMFLSQSQGRPLNEDDEMMMNDDCLSEHGN